MFQIRRTAARLRRPAASFRRRSRLASAQPSRIRERQIACVVGGETVSACQRHDLSVGRFRPQLECEAGAAAPWRSRRGVRRCAPGAPRSAADCATRARTPPEPSPSPRPADPAQESASAASSSGSTQAAATEASGTNAISARVPRDARTESRLWSPPSASPVHGEGSR